MKSRLFGPGIVIAILIFAFLSNSTLASENIYGLRIENINKSGADFRWSTAIETKGTLEYAYTKLAELYNPQSPGSQQSVLVSAVPLQTKSEDGYRRDHHIKIDNLDMDESPFIQYTIKSQAFSGETYEISGEFVLVDTGKINWWQNWWFPIVMFVLGQIAWPTLTIRIWKRIRPNKTAQK